MRRVVLAGSGEFLPVMRPVDEAVLRHAGRHTPRVVIVPTASGLEGPVPFSWIERGVRHFIELGCEAVGVPILSRAEADHADHAEILASADLIYLSGGNPRHLVESLRDTAAWAAIRSAWTGGAVLAGSSAGAMALAAQTVTPRTQPPSWLPALGLIAGIGVLPHYDRFGAARVGPLVAVSPPDFTILGIDEDTVVFVTDESATVMGVGTVTVWQAGEATVYVVGEDLPPGLVRFA